MHEYPRRSRTFEKKNDIFTLRKRKEKGRRKHPQKPPSAQGPSPDAMLKRPNPRPDDAEVSEGLRDLAVSTQPEIRSTRAPASETPKHKHQAQASSVGSFLVSLHCNCGFVTSFALASFPKNMNWMHIDIMVFHYKSQIFHKRNFIYPIFSYSLSLIHLFIRSLPLSFV